MDSVNALSVSCGQRWHVNTLRVVLSVKLNNSFGGVPQMLMSFGSESDLFLVMILSYADDAAVLLP